VAVTRLGPSSPRLTPSLRAETAVGRELILVSGPHRPTFAATSSEKLHFLGPYLSAIRLKAALLCRSDHPSGPVCPGIALLLAHCLAARPLPPAYGLGDGAKPPDNQQELPVAALHQLWQDGAAMNESEKQFSFTRAASITMGARKTKFLSVDAGTIKGLNRRDDTPTGGLSAIGRSLQSGAR